MRGLDTTRRGFLAMTTALACTLAGCAASNDGGDAAGSAAVGSASGDSDEGSSVSGTEREVIVCDADEAHAIEVSAETASYAAVDVIKTGDADGDEADFYGTNAAVFATDGATLELDDVTVTCDGKHANAVFSYGEGTTVKISDSTIDTTSDCSGGIMVTGGGTLEAQNLTIHTTGNSSAAIRSDRGGGTQLVTGGSYTTDGTGSPVIYSTADVTVTGASLTSTASQGVVVEGKNSVSLVDCDLVASNTTKNGDKSDWYQAVMIYQSMSGDADEGEASFSMRGGSLTNENGDVFFVNNTVCTIGLEGVEIANDDPEGVFLRAAAAGWGSEGSNGGQVTLSATAQQILGDLLADEVSHINLYLAGSSVLTGSVNPDGAAGEVYVDLSGGSTWVLKDDSHVTGLTCEANSIDLNGHALYVGDEAYVAGSESSGEPIEATVTSGGTGGPGDGGTPPEAPTDGNIMPFEGMEGEPPEMP